LQKSLELESRTNLRAKTDLLVAEVRNRCGVPGSIIITSPGLATTTSPPG
jgi:hypothetical protein